MTFPRVYKKGKPKTFNNIDKEATKLRMNRPVPSESEIEETLREADEIENEYFRLRAKAIIALGVIFGKRRVEISLLEMEDIKVEGEFLYLVFSIVKKT